MENSKRSYGHEGSGRRPLSRKPPRGSWQPSVPSWEKTFCKVVGSLDWETLLDMKKFLYLYDNVLKWNDSAGEEAFHSAKDRFWAELRGVPCDRELPNPDLYIDEIDWECKIDEDLLSDLECRSFVDSFEKSDTVIIFGDLLTPKLPFSPTGWGDSEDTFQKIITHGNQQECSYEKSNGSMRVNRAGGRAKNSWDLDNVGGPVRDDECRVGWDDSCGGGNHEADRYGPKFRNCDRVKSWEKWDDSDANRLRAGLSRYKVSRFHGEGNNPNHLWRNEKGKKKETYAWEETNTGSGKRTPSGGWNFNACGPVTHHASSNGRPSWSWKKPVS